MTLNTTGYTVGTNEPLNHARILWDMLEGTATGDGTNPSFATNDYTAQRWELAAGANDWTLTLGAAADVDTVFISAHNLSGITFRPQYLGADVTNLLTYSEQFDNAAWDNIGDRLSFTSGQADPSGSASAYIIEQTIDGTEARVGQSFSASISEPYIFSTFVKKGNTNWVHVICFEGSSGVRAWFNIDSGVVGSVVGFGSGFSVESQLIDSIGDGWYRISLSVSVPSTNPLFGIALSDADGLSGITTPTGTNALIWGAQLQAGSEATSYIKTEATAVTSGWRDLASWITPADNSTIAILANDASGDPYSTTGVRLAVSNAAADTRVGIIRAGNALQMQRSFYGGYAPIRLNRVTEGQQSFSETGQWIGRTEKRRALSTTYSWEHLRADWYRANFDPFAQTLPLKPFGIVGNPSRMAEDVAWAWTQKDPAPSNMGIRDLMQVSLNVTGYWS